MTLHPETIGIDIAKQHLDVFDPRHGRVHRCPNTCDALLRLAAEWARRKVFIIFEATGAYDAPLREILDRQGIVYARVNPEQARHFARALGGRAKTDALDARMLAKLGERLKPRPCPPRDPARERLALWHKRRDQLVASRQQERTRLAECRDEALKADIANHLAFLDQAIEKVEATLKALLAESPSLRERQRLLRSVPGVGALTAITLTALMPELGALTPKTIAALGGLAPYNNDSGAFKGQRSVRGGRKRLRDALYMAALAAARSRSRLGDFYRALRNAGKPPKLALIALARKILVILNAIVREQKPFTA